MGHLLPLFWTFWHPLKGQLCHTQLLINSIRLHVKVHQTWTLELPLKCTLSSVWTELCWSAFEQRQLLSIFSARKHKHLLPKCVFNFFLVVLDELWQCVSSLAPLWIQWVNMLWGLGCESCETPSCNQRPGSLNMYANSGLFSGVSVWILFTVVNVGVTGLKCVTIWLPWHF